MDIKNDCRNILLVFSELDRADAQIILASIDNGCKEYNDKGYLLGAANYSNRYGPIHPLDIKEILNKLSETGLVTINTEIVDKNTGLLDVALIRINNLSLLRKCLHVLSYPEKYNVEPNTPVDSDNYAKTCKLVVKSKTKYEYHTPEGTVLLINFKSSDEKYVKVLNLLIERDGTWVKYSEFSKFIPMASPHHKGGDRVYPTIADLRKHKFTVESKFDPFEIAEKKVRLKCDIQK